MQPNQPDKEQRLREALLVIRQTLQKEFAMIPVDNHLPLLKSTLEVFERTLRIAQKKKLTLPAFARQIFREQAQIWLLRNGQTREQRASEQWIWDKNETGLSAYLRHYSFRTNDVVADVISQTFHTFFQNVRGGKPLITLLQAYLVKIAKGRALHELRAERKADKYGTRVQLQSLAQTFIDVDDAEFGSLRVPIPMENEDEESITLSIEGELISVPMKSFLQFLQECLEQLGAQRQEAIRLRFRFLSDADLESMGADEVTEFISGKMNSKEIADALGYANAQVVNTRTNENVKRLHTCIQTKIRNSEGE
ncbi:hypothetical protein GCM10028805_64590 [Spirosoma harenae]